MNWAYAIPYLSPEEFEHTMGHELVANREKYAISHFIKRMILGQLTNKSPSELKFACGRFGKPYLVDGCGWQFSMSHAEQMLAIAVSKDSPIGIDIERDREIPEAKQICCAVPNLQSLNDQGHFISAWVRMEAEIKALGSSLALKLPKCKTESLFLTTCPHYRGAIAACRRAMKIKQWFWPRFDATPQEIFCGEYWGGLGSVCACGIESDEGEKDQCQPHC